MHDKKNRIVPYSETTTGITGSSVSNLTNSLGSPTTTSRVVHFPRTNSTTSNLHSLGKGRSGIRNIISNTANIATTYEDIPRIPQALALRMLKKTLAHLKAHHEETLRVIEERDKIRLLLAIQDIKAEQKQRRQQEQEEHLRKQKQQLEAQRQHLYQQGLQEPVSLAQANSVPQPQANVLFSQQQPQFWY